MEWRGETKGAIGEGERDDPESIHNGGSVTGRDRPVLFGAFSWMEITDREIRWILCK